MRKQMPAPIIDPEVADLLRFFLPTRSELVEEAKAAVAAGDWIKTRTIGHKLRGSFGLYGLDRLAALAEELMLHPPSTSLDERLRVLVDIENEIDLVKQTLSGNL